MSPWQASGSHYHDPGAYFLHPLPAYLDEEDFRPTPQGGHSRAQKTRLSGPLSFPCRSLWPDVFCPCLSLWPDVFCPCLSFRLSLSAHHPAATTFPKSNTSASTDREIPQRHDIHNSCHSWPFQNLQPSLFATIIASASVSPSQGRVLPFLEAPSAVGPTGK